MTNEMADKLESLAIGSVLGFIMLAAGVAFIFGVRGLGIILVIGGLILWIIPLYVAWKVHNHD